MKSIITYKLHKDVNGNLYHPSWLLKSGFYYDGKSYVGTVDHSGNDYYIPTGLTTLTPTELKERVKAIQINDNLDTYTDVEGVILTEDEISTMVDEETLAWDEVTDPTE